MTRIPILCALMVACSTAPAQEPPAPPQRNLVTFFEKCRAGGPVRVAYLGGSITAQNGWRPFTTQWLREQYKDAEIEEVNAAIGGTGSLLGAFRLQKHVLQHDPDLLFVEFAVNDRNTPDESVLATMEGIVRQAWGREKKPDVVFVYTTAGDLDVPTQRHQAVADAYGIPTVDFQASIQAVCNPGLIDWDILARDRVHPGDWGHAIYAATLATFLRKQMQLQGPAIPPPDTLPAPSFSDLYQTARLVPVTENAHDGWKLIEPAGHFSDGSIMATDVGQTIEFGFAGTTVGLYYEIRKDAGIVSCEIDRQPVREVDTSWGPRYRFNRQNCTIIANDLAPGEHALGITVLDKRHELSEGHEFHLGYLMVAG